MENNRFLAEFMGYKYMSTDEIIKWLGVKNIERLNRIDDSLKPIMRKDDIVVFDNFLDYHSSWSWLMPVVEKIESIDCSKFSYEWEQGAKNRYNFKYPEVNIQGENCYIGFDCTLDPFTEICDCYGDTKIEATYKACVEFIEWYNECRNN